VLSAIVIVGPEYRDEESNAFTGEDSAKPPRTVAPDQEGVPLVCVDLLGQSVLARFLDELRRGGIERISVLGNFASTTVGADSSGIEFNATEEPWRSATQQLLAREENKENNGDPVLVVRLGAYVDLDLKGFFQFHHEQKQAISRVLDKEGALDFWIMNPAGVAEGIDIATVLHSAEPAPYVVPGYVNRLQHPRDLRRLVVDSFTNRCRLRPLGTETRPGVWIEEGAQVHRDARIVAPAFIGRGTRIGEQCLITRSSNVESSCQIDYGTVVEDSSILSNSYVGIGLDLSHSIVDGNNLLNLERGVTLEISDPCVIRPNRVPRQDKNLKLPATFGLGNVHFSQVEESSRQT
jgi:NDP-sugar pyrophosphorylase family protein